MKNKIAWDRRAYYLKNREKMIQSGKNSYRKRINAMTAEELKEYRKRQAQYYRQWYLKKVENRKQKIGKDKKTDDMSKETVFNFSK